MLRVFIVIIIAFVLCALFLLLLHFALCFVYSSCLKMLNTIGGCCCCLRILHSFCCVLNAHKQLLIALLLQATIFGYNLCAVNLCNVAVVVLAILQHLCFYWRKVRKFIMKICKHPRSFTKICNTTVYYCRAMKAGG